MRSLFSILDIREREAITGTCKKLWELLVVIIIIANLAGFAAVNLLSQVAKGRIAEGKSGVGALNRAQQVYRTEKQIFW